MARVTGRPSWWRSRHMRVDGAATAAVLAAVAQAFEVRTRAVTLVTGATSRTKVLDVDIDDAEGHRRWVALLDS